MSSAAQPATPAPDPFKTIFNTLGQHLLKDVESPAFTLLDNFFANLKANPTTQNALAQGAILAASAPLQLPNLEQSSIGDLATAGQAAVAQLKAMAGAS